MLRDLKSSVLAVVVLTLLFGLAIPAAFTDVQPVDLCADPEVG